MSMVGGMGGSLSSYMQKLQQDLFSKIDANSDGNVTKSELEQAVTSAGGTSSSADALFGDLDPTNSGSVSEQQFAQNLPPPGFSPEMGGQLIAAQAQSTGDSSGADPASAFVNQIFSQITGGGSTLTQSELEKAVTSAGGTTASADALYAQLDPNNTGSVSEQQFAANLFNGSTASASGDGNSATDAMDALMKSLASSQGGTSGPQGAHGHHHHHHIEDSSTTSADGSSDSDSAQDALQALLGSLDSSSTQTAASTGNSAQDALFDLLQANSSTGSGATSTLPSSTFGHVSQQMMSLMLQMQEQNQIG